MRNDRIALVATLTALLLSAWSPSATAEVVVQTQAWDNTDAAFEEFSQQIRSHHGRNLLARLGVRVIAEKEATADQLFGLIDGQAGTRAQDGRVMLNGQPTVIDFYLGEPKTVTEVGLFTFNTDTRSNQDFEVRFADNHQNPAAKPKFPRQADLSSGEVILGRDGGGFYTRFARDDGGPLVPDKVDWVQFRIWRTHGTKAGDPAKTETPGSAAAYIELEALGEEGDVVAATADQLALRKAQAEASKAPELVEKATWQETMIAGREAVRQWESLQDRLAAYQSNVIFGPWYSLGPLHPKSTELAELRNATEIDLGKRHLGKDDREIGWQERRDLGDGTIHDLSDPPGTDSSDVFLLCRAVTFLKPPQKNEYAIEITADKASATWLPSQQRLSVQNTFESSKGGALLTEMSGRCQLLLEVRAGGDGKHRFCFLPQPSTSKPGAGAVNQRMDRRKQLIPQIREMFADPIARAQIDWEASDGIWVNSNARNVEDWLPGHVDTFLEPRYERALAARLADLEAELTAESGIQAQVLEPIKDRIAAWIETMRSSITPELSVDELRSKYYRMAAFRDALATASKTRSMRLSVADQRTMFGDRYPKADEYLRRVAALEKQADAIWDRLFSGSPDAMTAVIELREEIDRAGTEILLANPLLQFDKLLLVKGNPSFSSNWGGPNSLGSEMAVLSPVRPDGELTTIHQGAVADMDLHWNAQTILFSDRQAIWEIHADGSGLRRVTPEDDLLRYDGCYLPNGQMLCVSNACQQAVPCTGGPNVGNIHLINADGTGERRLTFDQDHDWNPVVMHDGRVLYTRWEYTDAPHYFSRLLFRMNPDGSGQMEYYGSNSYWPNATYWPRPIPGHPTMISCVISGHHGVSRVGEFLLLDPAKGRHEADGAVQKIPGYGKKVEPTMLDRLVVDSWPKFAAPYPLAEPETNLGAGKYFLVCVKEHEHSTWDLCLADIYDNITPILRGGYMTPIPLRPRPQPPAIPSQVDPRRKDATVYLANVYAGPGLNGFPRGSIKQLRVGTHHYRYFGNGDTRASSLEGGWDVKRILGTVPVNEDGSALFSVPANTPIFLQPLDEKGKAQQVMRSWFTAMPGEFLSCVGCHEKQNAVPPSAYSTAAIGQRPSTIEPWYGPVRGFGFEREIQPMLDRRCVGCHNDRPYDDAGEQIATIDLRAKRLRGPSEPPDPTAPKNKYSDSDYSPAYRELQKYVRRPGYESDYHMPKPAEYEADTSMLVQMLEKGHYNVKLAPEEWERLYAWIDYNVPYPINWRESHRPPTDEQVALRAQYKKLYAGVDDRDEDPVPLPPIEKFQPPEPSPSRPADPVQLTGWPMAAEQAQEMQAKAGSIERELDLGDGVTMKLLLLPAGEFPMGAQSSPAARGFATATTNAFPDEGPQTLARIPRPFWIGQFEVTNGQFAQFDPEHDSGVINERWKDRSRRGTAIDSPELPVVRITWYQAMEFCRWLSEETGHRCTLPTEAQWEWACRAGTATTFSVGPYTEGVQPFANLADETARPWNHGRAETGYNDGVSFTAPGGQYPPNAWGLYDMHGNVAEWCRSIYRPYPYDPRDGRDDPSAPGMKVVRGGSWNDTLKFATSASRWRYQPYKPVYNVGFRVVVEADAPEVAAASEGE